jgi:hypothetical protein
MNPQTATMAYAKQLAEFIVKEGNYPLIDKIIIQTDFISENYVNDNGGYKITEVVDSEEKIIEILAKKIYEFQP